LWLGAERRGLVVCGQIFQPPKARGYGGMAPALGDFYTFSIKITHFYAYFGQNSYFKAIIHQLKALEKQSKPETY